MTSFGLSANKTYSHMRMEIFDKCNFYLLASLKKGVARILHKLSIIQKFGSNWPFECLRFLNRIRIENVNKDFDHGSVNGFAGRVYSRFRILQSFSGFYTV